MEKKLILTLREETIQIDNPDNLNPVEIIGMLEVAKIRYRIDFTTKQMTDEREADSKKTLLTDFIESISSGGDSVQNRLLHALRANEDWLPKYAEDVDLTDLRKLRNCGERTVQRFKELLK